MNFINCSEELLTARYEYLKNHMKSGSKIRIFNISSWAEPWGFGRENKAEVSKIYKEAVECIFDDDVDYITDDECSDYIITVLSNKDEVGIVWISEDPSMFMESMEDLFNIELASAPNRPVNLGSSPNVKKPDNLVINRLNLFK